MTNSFQILTKKLAILIIGYSLGALTIYLFYINIFTDIIMLLAAYSGGVLTAIIPIFWVYYKSNPDHSFPAFSFRNNKKLFFENKNYNSQDEAASREYSSKIEREADEDSVLIRVIERTTMLVDVMQQIYRDNSTDISDIVKRTELANNMVKQITDKITNIEKDSALKSAFNNEKVLHSFISNVSVISNIVQELNVDNTKNLSSVVDRISLISGMMLQFNTKIKDGYREYLSPMQTNEEDAKILNNIIDRTNKVSVMTNQFTDRIRIGTENSVTAFTELLMNINNSIKSTTNVMDKVRERMVLCVENSGKNSKSLNDNSLQTIKDRYEVMINEVLRQFELTVLRKKEDISTLDHIKESADKIRPFAGEIASIASTTKLLSLNAFIEAARAREHGKAFGVVASEVRQLADQSKLSADNMNSILNNIMSFIEESIIKLKDAIDIESLFIQSTMVLLKDVVMSLVESFVAISEAVERTLNLTDSSKFRAEVNNIVVNLQFEDICHQMSTHTVHILESIKNDINSFIAGEKATEENEQFSKTFAFDAKIAEAAISERRIENIENEDDVTFF